MHKSSRLVEKTTSNLTAHQSVKILSKDQSTLEFGQKEDWAKIVVII